MAGTTDDRLRLAGVWTGQPGEREHLRLKDEQADQEQTLDGRTMIHGVQMEPTLTRDKSQAMGARDDSQQAGRAHLGTRPGWWADLA